MTDPADAVAYDSSLYQLPVPRLRLGVLGRAHLLPRFVSDLSGKDIRAHGNDPAHAILAVRNFLLSASGVPLPGGAAIAALYAQFIVERPAILRKAWIIEPTEIIFADTTAIIFEWPRHEAVLTDG